MGIVKNKANPYRQILAEQSPLKERLLAIALKAFEDGGIDHFRYRHLPVSPTGFDEDYLRYKTTADDSKSKEWKKIIKDYFPYLKKRWEIESENLSNKVYLKEVLAIFKEKEMDVHAKRLEEILKEFD